MYQSFNSTLVQLKVFMAEKTITTGIRFNSTLVQLKAASVAGQVNTYSVSILP